MNKKGIELSINFLVVIILSIVIVTFSVIILTSIVGKAGELNKMTQEDLDKRIESLQCTGIVCFAVNYKELERGDFHIFGLKVFTRDEGNFELKVEQASPATPKLLFQPKNYTFSLDGNDETRIGIGFEIPKNATSGLYIFNVKILKGTQAYGNPQQIRIDIPE